MSILNNPELTLKIKQLESEKERIDWQIRILKEAEMTDNQFYYHMIANPYPGMTTTVNTVEGSNKPYTARWTCPLTGEARSRSYGHW